MEKWKDIAGYEGRYQASDLGNIKSLISNKILKPRIDKNGYFKVILYTGNGDKKEFRLHRLIAETFIPNPENFPQVNHINEDKTNNAVDNLEWCTSLQNNNHGTRNERIRPHAIAAGMKSAKAVQQYDKKGNLIKTWDSLRSVERELNIPHSNIIASIKRNGSAGGYIWKLLDNN